jgi:ABC-type branched-subunit amino acid transport system substrate-binding protein
MRSRRRGWRLLAIFAVFALFAASCADDDDDTEDPPTTEAPDETTPPDDDDEEAAEPGASVDGVLTLGSVMPLTGDLQDFGPGMQAAVEMAVEDINGAGGVLGEDVVLVNEDSGSDPSIAGPGTDRLVSTEDVDVIIGAAGSTVVLQGVLPNTVPAGRMACSGSSTSPELTLYDDDGLFFRTTPSDEFQTVPLVDNITAAGFSSVAVVNRADDYGQAFADLTVEALEDAGADVVASVAVDPEGTDYTADVEQVIDAGPDAVVLILFPEEGANILSLMIERGAGPDDLGIFVTDGLASPDLGEAIDESDPSVVDGIIGTRPGAAEEPEAFNQRLQDEKGVDEVTFAAQFYDCVIATALAAVAADTDDPVEIAANMAAVTSDGTECSTFEDCLALLEDGEDINYRGVTGFDLSEEGEVAAATYEVWEFVDGEISSIEVVTIATDDDDDDDDELETDDVDDDTDDDLDIDGDDDDGS